MDIQIDTQINAAEYVDKNADNFASRCTDIFALALWWICISYRQVCRYLYSFYMMGMQILYDCYTIGMQIKILIVLQASRQMYWWIHR